MTEGRIYRGWKAIARRLGVSVRTARRYEKEHGLPVRRRGTVYVTQAELAEWEEGNGQ